MDRMYLAAGIVLATLAAAPASAESPRVHFDMPFTLACRDVTSAEFAAANPSHRLVEARFEISSLLLAGKERDLTQFFIRIDSPQRSLAVVDYLPQTHHESRLASPIGVTKTDETNASIGINVAGKYEILTAVGATAGLGQKNTSCVKYDLLPPLETVAASGTLLRGAGVFFKLNASPRHPLEGAREFALVLRVPIDWRVDYVRVRCEAQAIERGLVSSLDQSVAAGQREFLVSLYQEGDEAARLRAEEFALRDAAARTSAAAAREKSQPSSPAAWLSKLLVEGKQSPPRDDRR
jgi:hypothetical protein